MKKTEIKNQFESVVFALNVKDNNRLKKDLWVSYILYLYETEEIEWQEYLELFKEF